MEERDEGKRLDADEQSVHMLLSAGEDKALKPLRKFAFSVRDDWRRAGFISDVYAHDEREVVRFFESTYGHLHDGRYMLGQIINLDPDPHENQEHMAKVYRATCPWANEYLKGENDG